MVDNSTIIEKLCKSPTSLVEEFDRVVGEGISEVYANCESHEISSIEILPRYGDSGNLEYYSTLVITGGYSISDNVYKSFEFYIDTKNSLDVFKGMVIQYIDSNLDSDGVVE